MSEHLVPPLGGQGRSELSAQQPLRLGRGRYFVIAGAVAAVAAVAVGAGSAFATPRAVNSSVSCTQTRDATTETWRCPSTRVTATRVQRVTATVTKTVTASPSASAPASAPPVVSAPPPPTASTALHLFGAPQAVASYVAQYPQLATIANQPESTWVMPEQTLTPAARIQSLIADAAGKTAQLVVYGIPGRDSGSYSAGGPMSESQYYAWISSIGYGIGSGKAIVTLEPDSIGLLSRLSASDQTARLRMLSTAVTILKKQPNVRVYIDASTWLALDTDSQLLAQANIGHADGFALNVSGFQTLNNMYTYGDSLSSLVGGKHFVIDTSRNGQGPLGNPTVWCNPPGRGPGALPQGSAAGHPLVDALLWLKLPGESDGSCNGAPPAGQFWPAYALGLISNANTSTS